MKREVKYRVWDYTYNEFRYWGFIDGMFVGPPTGSKLSLKECKDNSEQFTGLQDRDGVDIYEGDIIYSSDTFQGEITQVVESLLSILNDMSMPGGNWEVIGNIHQNPELI